MPSTHRAVVTFTTRPVCWSTRARSPSGFRRSNSTLIRQTTPPWDGPETDIALTCTSTSLSHSDTRGALQVAIKSSRLIGAINLASTTRTSCQASLPRTCQTTKKATKTTSAVTTTAPIRGPRRPDKNPLAPELLLIRSPMVGRALPWRWNTMAPR